MNQRQLALVSVVVLAVIVIGAVIFVRMHPSQNLQTASTVSTAKPLQMGDKAPQFQVPTTAGPFDLNAQTKPVFLEVFATWCPHCQRETANIDRLYQKYRDRVAFISIPGSTIAMNHSDDETQGDVFAFAQQFKVQYPIAVYDPNLSIANQYLGSGFPTFAVIDRNKKIAYYNTGEVAYAELDSALSVVTR